MEQQRPVLITLDDDESIAMLIQSIGERAGFDATALTESDGFAEQLKRTIPDVMVLDLQMPGHDGISVLRYLADEKVDARIVLVTGTDERTIASAKQYGISRGLDMAETLQKPFDPEELYSILENAHAALRAVSVADLELAIERDELVVHYQPTIKRFADGTWDVEAVEALIRWDHPLRGLLKPEAFLSMGEEHGLSRVMTDFVFQQGIQQLRAWSAQRLRIGLRVNIAAPLIADLDFPDRMETLLTEQGIDPDRLTLEVTETAMLHEDPATFDILTRLRLKDINLAIDDFGIGYSSLTQLFRMPFNEIKIDKSIVGRAKASKEASIMIDALVSLAHKLKLNACAEGVEDEETLEYLTEIECDAAQGFLISPPVCGGDIPAILDNWGRHLGTFETNKASA